MIKDYIKLTKPGIIVGNVITAISGYLLGSSHGFKWGSFFAMFTGLSMIIASGCVFNNYKDRFIDQKMDRTKARALVQGVISKENALRFGSVLISCSIIILFLFTNTLTMLFAILGFIVYVNIYTPMKIKSEYGTLIGSIAGAVPPVVGYTAATNQVNLCAMILFLIVTFWQMPHFYAIAMYRSPDYERAQIPVLPLVYGFHKTKIQMAFYTALFVLSSSLLYFLGYAGMPYFIATLILGLVWFFYSLTGFHTKCDTKWAKTMFKLSLIVVMGMSFMLSINNCLIT